jgi:nucleoside-diphosphate-sugar epimerase
MTNTTPKTILVTGATGYTGQALALHLASQGHRVRTLARKTSNTQTLAQNNIEIIYGDITNADDVHRAVAGCELVYHIAACFRTAGHTASYYHAVNVDGARFVIDACRKHNVHRLIHCSTGGVHGSVKQIPSDESAPFRPGDLYQLTKLQGEQLAQNAIKQGQPISIFRPAGIYGPGDQRFLKLFKTIQQRRFFMFGSGKTLFHMIYIDDLVDGIIRCGQSPQALGQTYLLAGPRYFTLNELAQTVANILHVEPRRGRLPIWPLYVGAAVCETFCVPLRINPPLHRRRVDFFTKNRAFSCDKARRELGYNPKIDLQQGLAATANWYFEHGQLNRPNH